MNETYIAENLNDKIHQLTDELKRKYPEIETLHLYLSANNSLYIGSIRIQAEHRRKGIGSEIIKLIKKFADDNNLIIVLAPFAEPRYKEKLDRFYKSLGFVTNKGRHRDYQLSDPFAKTMYRRPGVNH